MKSLLPRRGFKILSIDRWDSWVGQPQERGPRYVNNVAVFVKKGQKDIDANEHLDGMFLGLDVAWLKTGSLDIFGAKQKKEHSCRPELHAAAQGGSFGEERCALLSLGSSPKFCSRFLISVLSRKKRRPKKRRRKKINKRHKLQLRCLLK